MDFGAGFWISDSGVWISDFGFWTKLWMLHNIRILSTPTRVGGLLCFKMFDVLARTYSFRTKNYTRTCFLSERKNLISIQSYFSKIWKTRETKVFGDGLYFYLFMKEYPISKRLLHLVQSFYWKIKCGQFRKQRSQPQSQKLENQKIIPDSSESRAPPPRLSDNCFFSPTAIA